MVTVDTQLTVRLAQPGEGPLLHTLAQESGKWEITGLDWSFDPYPWWLIADVEGVPTGCLQVCPGIPLGRLEFLCVPTATPHVIKAKVVRALLLHGLAACRAHGAQFVTGMLHTGLEGYARIIERRGGVKWFTGDAYLFRVKT